MKVKDLIEYSSISTRVRLEYAFEHIGTYRDADDIPNEYRERDVWRIGVEDNTLVIVIVR